MNQLNDWLPVFSEQWATTYVQILFGLIVFALSTIAVAFGLNVPEDVRYVLQRRWHLKLLLALVITLFSISLLFIGVVQPLQKAAGATETGQPPQPQQPVAPPQPAGAWGRKKSIAVVLMVGIPFLTFAGGLILFDRCRRARVVGSVAKSLSRSYRKRRILREADLEDLMYLGSHGKAGEQKQVVLGVIDRTATEVQGQEHDYNGSELEDLIRGIEAVLRYESQRGNDENFEHAAAILNKIWSQLSRHNYAYSSDAIATLYTLKTLGIYAARNMSAPTALVYVQEAAECDSDILFEMGVAALKSHNFFIASAALVKLESLASLILAPRDNGAAPPQINARDNALEVRANLIGLLAYFMTSGVSARRRALLAFTDSATYFKPTREAAFEEAFDYHYNMSRYETADKVFALPELLGKGESVPDWKTIQVESV